MFKALAKLFVGKKTYAALAVLLLKWIAQSQGIEIADEQLSAAVDVGLVLAAGFGRHLTSVAAEEKAAGRQSPPELYKGGSE